MKTIKVLVVDDHDAFRASLSRFLGEQGGVQIVGEATDGLEAVAQTERLRPDLVLMDIDMPGRDGFEATREIKLSTPKTRVVILSMHGSELYRRKAWRYAADGFIDKSELKDDLLEVLTKEKQGLHGGDSIAV